MKITADTNVLVRAIMGDDEEQSAAATAALDGAELVAITTSALCELVWVLARSYKIPSAKIAEAIRRLIAADNVSVDRPMVGAGISVLDSGGDFADGVIAFQGKWLGADTFVSFDKRAVSLLRNEDQSAQLLT